MRLKIFESGLESSLRSFIRRIDKKLSEIVDAKTGRVDSLIVLGDGNEDARVILLLCHHLDGKKAVGVIKPVLKRYGAIQELKRLNIIMNCSKIVFVFDQEDDDLDELYRDVENELNGIGIKFEKGEKFSISRIRSYSCSLGGHVFELVVVVNGLDEVGGPNHKIEDHLVKLAGVASKGDSKEVWNKLDEDERFGVYRKILNDRKDAEGVFAQHFAGLGLLD